MEAIMIFMSQEKEFADQNNRQTSRYQERGGGGGRGQRRGQGRSQGQNNLRQGQGDQELKRCTQHDGLHLWRECPENSKSDAYKRIHERGQERGRGRGRSDPSYHT